MSELLQYFTNRQQTMVDLLEQLVNHETFSQDKTKVDELTRFMEAQFNDLGATTVTRIPQAEVGDMLLAKWHDDAPGKHILFLIHIDTVWGTGTLAQRPVTIDDEGRLYGPGAIDMKGGITIVLSALRGLTELNQLPQRPIWVLMTTDEEIGSPNSEQIIKDNAQNAGLVLVMEPATKDGAIKSWRKGVANYTLRIEGRASHAGNAPEEGVNAIIEFAQQALKINEMNDLRNGTSVSVTMVSGGSAGNVIPAHLEAHIDVRMMTMKAMEKITHQLDELHSFIPGAKVTVTRQHHRPPMERQASAVEQAKAIGQKYGITVRDDGSGGGSDGNFTAAMGIPTLDGLGAEGDGLHALHEHVLIRSLPRKAALIAGILCDWQFPVNSDD